MQPLFRISSIHLNHMRLSWVCRRWVVLDCRLSINARKEFQDVFSTSTVPVGHFLDQPDFNGVAIFLTRVKLMPMNLVG